ncbi:hypothetical protein HPB47_020658 [Ixodes persulcatus]|uniref:Uncharacterized protein n=1 Tax=Ixodes persulcatus TaxID=34615 RepID=A0AC60QIB4_IXOPE|nr:hypothetical protein HPB47_020658 [Ixodes persulcatus]
MGIETSGGVPLKQVFGLGGTFGTKYNSETTTTDSQTKLKTFAVSTGVNVPPGRTVQVEWYASTAQSWTPVSNRGILFLVLLHAPIERRARSPWLAADPPNSLPQNQDFCKLDCHPP